MTMVTWEFEEMLFEALPLRQKAVAVTTVFIEGLFVWILAFTNVAFILYRVSGSPDVFEVVCYSWEVDIAGATIAM